MVDLIDRQAAISLAKDVCVPTADGSTWRHRCIDPDEIRELPPAQPEQKVGKWIIDGHHIRCSVCDGYMCSTDREGDKIPTNFCPNCGAKMNE